MVTLDDTNGVDPEVPNAQLTCCLNGMLKCPWKRLNGNASLVLFDISSRGEEVLLRSPAMGKCNVPEGISRFGLAKTNGVFLPGTEIDDASWHRTICLWLALMSTVTVLEPLTHKPHVLTAGHCEVGEANLDTLRFLFGFECLISYS